MLQSALTGTWGLLQAGRCISMGSRAQEVQKTLCCCSQGLESAGQGYTSKVGVTALGTPAGPIWLECPCTQPLRKGLQYELGRLREPKCPSTLLPPFLHLLRDVISLPFGIPYRRVVPETLGVPKSDLLTRVFPSSHLLGETGSWGFSKPQICAQRVRLTIWRRIFLCDIPTKRPSAFCLHISIVEEFTAPPSLTATLTTAEQY